MIGARALRAGKAVIELSFLTGNVEKGLKKLESRLRDFGTGLKSVGSTGLKLSGALGGMLGVTVKLAAEFEKTRAEFTALLGDAGKANKILGEIEKFALATPLASEAMQEATRTMLSFGVASDSVVPILKQLGEIAGGDSEKLKRLSLAFGQVNAKGRLMAQEVNQMIEAGFNPLQEISRTTGETMGSLAKRMEAGGIKADEVAKAFNSATSEGGRFFGLLDKTAQTAIGQWNNLSETLVLIGRDIGDALLPLVKELLADAAKMAERVGAWVKENTELAVAVAKATAALLGLSAAVFGLGVVASGAFKTIKGMRLAITFLYANPILAGLAALAEAFYEISRAATSAEKAIAAGVAAGALGGFLPSTGLHGAARPANAFPVAPHVNQPTMRGSGVGFTKGILGGFGSAIGSSGDLMNSIIRGARAQVGGAVIGAGLAAGQAQADQQVRRIEEAQRLEDELARARIDAMKDETEAQKTAKEEARIRLESAIRTRELERAGMLTPEIASKLAMLTEAQLDAAKKNGIGGLGGRSPEAIFATRFASQIFGGRQDEQLEELRQIRRNTDPTRNRANGGIAVEWA